MTTRFRCCLSRQKSVDVIIMALITFQSVLLIVFHLVRLQEEEHLPLKKSLFDTAEDQDQVGKEMRKSDATSSGKNITWHELDIITNDSISCSSLGSKLPENPSCFMKIRHKHAKLFQEYVIAKQYNIIHLRLHFQSMDSSKKIESAKCVIQPDRWVWTFDGKVGGKPHLDMPNGYSIWSLRLLDIHTRQSVFNIDVQVHGDCPVIIGQNSTRERIGKALIDMNNAFLGKDGDDVGNATQDTKYMRPYFCYRTFNESTLNSYEVCKYRICFEPIIEYTCCNQTFNYRQQTWQRKCGTQIHYKGTWWYASVVLTLVAYFYSPLLCMWILAGFQDWTKSIKNPHYVGQQFGGNGITYIKNNTVTFSGVISRPVGWLLKRLPDTASLVLCRFVFMCLTLSVVFVECMLFRADKNQKDFIIAAVNRGIPFDFLTFLAEKPIFLIEFGGPVRAVCVYCIISILLMFLPIYFTSDLSEMLGIDRKGFSGCLIPLDFSARNKLDTMYFQKSEGRYRIIWNAMVTDFYMLLDVRFWSHVFSKNRLQSFFNHVPEHFCDNVPCTVIFILIWIIEIILCFLYYPLPMINLWVRIYWGYIDKLWYFFKTPVGISRRIIRIVSVICLILLFVFLTVHCYIFSVIIIDSFLFLSRVFIFVFIGLFAYQAESYGYIVSSLTILIYVWDAISIFNKKNEELFIQSKEICKDIQTRKLCDPPVYRSANEDIMKSPFENIVDRHNPIRIEMFFILLKLVVVSSFVVVSIITLQSFQNFQDLATLTQALTTIFIGMIPKLLSSLYHKGKTEPFPEKLKDIERIILKCME